jgi:hypothetical protein
VTGHELAARLREHAERYINDPDTDTDSALLDAANVIEKQQRRLDALCLVLGCNCEGDD